MFMTKKLKLDHAKRVFIVNFMISDLERKIVCCKKEKFLESEIFMGIFLCNTDFRLLNREFPSI